MTDTNLDRAANTRAEASSAEPVADLAGYERGQRETVERIVAYLKERWPPKNYGEDWPVTYAIRAIEAGEWK